jgi:hypothetical protein
MATDLDLNLGEFGIVPGGDGQPDIIMASFKINPKALLSIAELEQMEYDAAFQDAIRGFDGPVSEPEEEDPKQKILDELKAELQKDLSDDDWLAGD